MAEITQQFILYSFQRGSGVLRIMRLLLLTGLLVAAFIAIQAQVATPRIDVLSVKGTINPVLVDYIERGIDRAEEGFGK